MPRKPGRKIKRVRAAPPPSKAEFEVTPERLGWAADDDHVYSTLVEATIEKAGERKVLTRRFADTHIDRMLKGKRLTYAQWYAADWYRTAHEQAGLGPRVVSNYDQAPSGGASSVGSKLLGSERQYGWRRKWREAREVIPERGRGMVERLVLQDEVPVLHDGRQRARYGADIARLLTPLAEWLNAPEHP